MAVTTVTMPNAVKCACPRGSEATMRFESGLPASFISLHIDIQFNGGLGPNFADLLKYPWRHPA
ncbi:Uncharacterised protein [Kluyvera cryocrescens]|uniref:Uncharacterized protein n=1 Tax=Kluyvera cryocrescens TaxID=580 RepID=A0A485AP14_KLUCR|nr:Uncharacterised protein [Kluyvera cryocrescens]